MYLLDTNICVALLKDADVGVRRRLASLEGEVCLCSIVRSELVYGAQHSSRVKENTERLERLFALFPSAPFDDEAADVCGNLRSHFRRLGTPIGAADLMIASTALSIGAVVVTRNEHEFRRVPGLRVEVW